MTKYIVYKKEGKLFCDEVQREFGKSFVVELYHNPRNPKVSKYNLVDEGTREEMQEKYPELFV